MTHVLIVEDQEAGRYLLKVLLEGNGYRVTQAVNGLEALAAARLEPPDIVVSDVLMPKMDGFALCRAWMQDAALKAIPFVFYSATYRDPEDEKLAQALGAARYLNKSLPADIFLAELRAVLMAALAPQRPVATALDDKDFYALHDAVLARKLEHKMGQIEAMNRALRESEVRYRDLVENSHDLICTHDLRGKLLSVNKAAVQITGYAEAALLGMNLFDLLTRASQTGFKAYLTEIGSTGAAHGMMRIRTAHGETRWWEYDNTLRTEGVPVPVVRGMVRDITEHKAADTKIQRLTNLYAALSACNQAIVRCTSEEQLFAEVCRDAVQYGGIKMAAIGLVDPTSGRLVPAAQCGEGTQYIEQIEITVDPALPSGRGTVGTAIREHRPVWCQDYLNDATTAPWHEVAAEAGWRSVATLPLYRNAVAVGVFVLFSGEINAFDQAARDLLTEMAADIGYALDNFVREAERRKAQQDLRESEQQFRGLVEQSIAGIYIIQDGKFVYVNPRFAQIFGYASEYELMDSSFAALSVVAEPDRGMVAENMRRRLEGEVQTIEYTFTGLRKDGTTVEVGTNGASASYHGQPAAIGLLQDISEKKQAEEKIRHYLEQLKVALLSTVEVATSLSELRDPYTAGHERRVAEIAAAIGIELGWDEERVEGLRVAGCLHDIGKITIPSEILSKPGQLSSIEYQLIQCHPQVGFDLLKNVAFPWPVAQVALQHQERMDGSGYPQGLKGEAIVFEARIMAVADVVEAMSSHRPYRAGLGIDKALAEIERGRGTAYDPIAADACLKLFRENGFSIPV